MGSFKNRQSGFRISKIFAKGGFIAWRFAEFCVSLQNKIKQRRLNELEYEKEI